MQTVRPRELQRDWQRDQPENVIVTGPVSPRREDCGTQWSVKAQGSRAVQKRFP